MKKNLVRIFSIVLIGAFCIQYPSPTRTYALPLLGTTERVSVSSEGEQANNSSYISMISANGRYVVFESDASNLVTGDTNGIQDIFVHDLWSGVTERVSISSSGEQGNRRSGLPSISSDGRYISFGSESNNLVDGDTNGVSDVFVHDLHSNTTERVSVTSSGDQANNASVETSISADGRYVAFKSWASNLVSGDTNNVIDIFVHDRQSGATERVSISSSGEQGNDNCDWPSISGDGRYVAFWSWANNLVSGRTDYFADVYVHDRQNGATERVSVSSSGELGNDQSLYPTISADGRFVAFVSYANNLVSGDTNGGRDSYVHDLQSDITERVSVSSSGVQANKESLFPSISPGGRYVAFYSDASNLVSGDTNGTWDIFLHDRQSGITERISVSSNGEQGNGISRLPSISADGRYVAFRSWASNLVSGDTNEFTDIFVHDRCPDGSCVPSSNVYIPLIVR